VERLPSQEFEIVLLLGLRLLLRLVFFPFLICLKELVDTHSGVGRLLLEEIDTCSAFYLVRSDMMDMDSLNAKTDKRDYFGVGRLSLEDVEIVLHFIWSTHPQLIEGYGNEQSYS
jgi:hypothetical protein